jgi:hypothetical protein
MSPAKELPQEATPLSDKQVTDLRRQLLALSMPELLVDRLLELIDSTGPASGYCPECKAKVYTDLPVWKYRIEAIKLCLDHTIGKPAERKVVQHTGIFDDLSKLTDDDLQRLLTTEE